MLGENIARFNEAEALKPRIEVASLLQTLKLYGASMRPRR